MVFSVLVGSLSNVYSLQAAGYYSVLTVHSRNLYLAFLLAFCLSFLFQGPF